MRKYILSVLFILTGLIVLGYGLFRSNGSSTYAEGSFAEQAEEFGNGFKDLIEQVEIDLRSLRSNFADPARVRDTLETRNYFLNTLRSREEMITLGFFQESYKVVSKKDGGSMIYAVDSTEILDVVRWQRFEKLSPVSSWYESFDQEIETRDWYKQLLSDEDKIIWFQGSSGDSSPEATSGNSIFCGYSYVNDQLRTILVFEYARDAILEKIGIKDHELAALILVRTSDGRTIRFDGGAWSEGQKDSLAHAVNQHFGRFIDQQRGTFKFSIGEKNYWSAFGRYPEVSGIDHYLYTIDENNLSSSNPAAGSDTILKVGTALFSIGILLLLLRTRYFYRRNRMEIPPLSELLADDENRYLEFKSSLRWDHRQGKVNPDLEKVILKTLAAFGNTDGGILLIGVDDDKNVIGLEEDFKSLKKQDSDYYEIHLRNILHKAMGVKYVSRHVRTQFETSGEGKTVCKVRVIAGDEPVFLKFKDRNGNLDEKFFVRSGNSSQEIESIPEINDYINKKFKK